MTRHRLAGGIPSGKNIPRVLWFGYTGDAHLRMLRRAFVELSAQTLHYARGVRP